MDKVRINHLARELEVKSKAILDYLPTIGVDDKKSHSSSLEGDLIERVRKHFAKAESTAAAEKRTRAASDEIKPKIDLSKISKPGDVLKAISKKTEPAVAAKPPEAPKPVAAPIAPRPAAPPAVAKPAAAAAPPAAARPAASAASSPVSSGSGTSIPTIS